jgi:hypothetical protein
VIRDIGERLQRDHYNQHTAHRYPPTQAGFAPANQAATI